MRLSELCHQKGVRPAELARAMGVARQSVDQYGRYRVTFLKLLEIRAGFEKLSIYFSLSELSELLNGKSCLCV